MAPQQANSSARSQTEILAYEVDNISNKEYTVQGMRGGRLFRIDFYRLPSGKAPVEEFLDGLETKMRNKAVDSISLLEEFGNQLTMPHSRAMGDGLYELRIKFAGDITRIFYFFFIENRIILTNGFVKKTVKTPLNELKLAKRYKADFLRRNQRE